MSLSTLSVRARLAAAVNAVIPPIFGHVDSRSARKRRRRPPTERELRAECERLEERRLLTAIQIQTASGPPYFAVYINYSYLLWQQGNCCEMGHFVQHGFQEMIRNDAAAGESYVSTYPVRYADGQPQVSDTDISSDGFGQSWGQTRTWADPAGSSTNGKYVNGNHWTDSQMPQIISDPLGSGDLVVIDDGNNQRWFAPTASANFYTEQAPPFSNLRIDSATSEYVVTDTSGSQEWFYNLSSTDPTKPPGQIAQYIDPEGHVTSFTYSNNQLTETQRANGNAVESWHYFYRTSGANVGELSAVVLRRSTTGTSGPWTDIREADYAYYTKTSGFTNADFGSLGDLQKVTIRVGAANDSQPGTGAVIGTEVYRYYTPYDQSTYGFGYVGALKYVFEPDADARAQAAGYDPLTTPITTANESQLQLYASNYFEYDNYVNPNQSVTNDHMVVKEIAHGGGCSCSADGGQGIYTYAYQGNTNYTVDGNYNQWKMRTTVNLPDGNTEIVYTNYAGEPILDVQKETATGRQWLTASHYDSNGNLVWQAHPSAVTGYSESYSDLVNYSPSTGTATDVSSNSGLVDVMDYYNVGWSISGAAGIASNNSAVSGTLAAHDGQQAAFLQDTSGSISQTFTAPSGQPSFTLNLWAGYLSGSGTAPTLEVLLDGNPLSPTYVLTTSYTSYSATLSSLSAGTHTITFKTISGTGTALIDSTSLSGTGAPALSDLGFESPTLASGTYVFDPIGSTATATVAAGIAGLLQDDKESQGLSGTPATIQQVEQFGYISQGGGNSGQSTAAGVTYLPGTDTLYGQTSNGDPRVTSDSYTFYSGTTQVQQDTSTLPPVPYGQDGPASSSTDTAHADVVTTYYDAYGRVQWTKDGDGHVNYSGYLDNTSGLDTGTGALTKTIVDVDYSKLTNTEQSLFPSGWSHPTGGLHIVTQYAVDGLGRPTRVIDPDNNVSYYAYNDANHEQRFYPGLGTAGQATAAGTTTTIVDTNLTGSSYVGDTVVVIGGTDSGQTSTVSAYNASTHTLTLSSALTIATDSTTAFILVGSATTGPIVLQREFWPSVQVSGQATAAGTTTTLTDTTNLSTSGSYVGLTVTVTAGTDAGQSATVTGYNSTTKTLTLSPAFNTATDTTTVYLLGSRTLYDEVLKSSAAPAITSGVPTGQETIDQTNIQTLSRQLTNGGGQVVEQDDYFSLSGVTYSQPVTYLGSSSNNTASGNYHGTLYGYDDRGRRNMVKMPTGTIYNTVYDDLGHAVSLWVGTNDTPTSGEWSPTNNSSPCNMIDVQDNAYDNGNAPGAPSVSSSSGGALQDTVYYVRVTSVSSGVESPGSAEMVIDVPQNSLLVVTPPSGLTQYNVYVSTTPGAEELQNSSPLSVSSSPTWTEPTGGLVSGAIINLGGVGDGNLTQVTMHPGSLDANHVTQMIYDFRDRLVAQKSGVQPTEDTSTHRPIIYNLLDNLGEVQTTYQYDGDQINLSDFASTATTDSAPTADATKLRAKTVYNYDDQGRLYETQTYSVDRSSGNATNR